MKIKIAFRKVRVHNLVMEDPSYRKCKRFPKSRPALSNSLLKCPRGVTKISVKSKTYPNLENSRKLNLEMSMFLQYKNPADAKIIS